MAGGGVVDGVAVVEGCLGGGVAGAAAEGLAGAAAGGDVAGDGAAVVAGFPAGCVRHSAMKSFFVLLPA